MFVAGSCLACNRLFSLRPAEAMPVGGLWKSLSLICLDRGDLSGVRVLVCASCAWLRSAGAYSSVRRKVKERVALLLHLLL